MQPDYCIKKLVVIIFTWLFIILNIAGTASAQLTDTARSISAIQPPDTTFNISLIPPGDTTKTLSPVKKAIREVAKSLAEQQQYVALSFDKRKIRHRIKLEDPLYKLPGGESRAVLFELPHYVDEYSLTIRSLVHGIGYKYHIFSPTGVFLDSSFRPTHLLSEKQFLIVNPTNYKALNIEAEVVIDGNRQMDKYLLIFTLDNSDRLATYIQRGLVTGLLRHPVERSGDGRLELKLNLK